MCLHHDASHQARAIVEHVAALLRTAGCESARRDAELLVADTLGVTVPELRDQAREVTPTMASRILHRAARRGAREPIEYIVGYVRFRRITLIVDPRVLVPNEATESTLVDIAVGLPEGARVHDVGTGSGAIALAIKYERPDLIVSGSDVSGDAIAVARLNAERLELNVDLTVARNLPPGHYDLVVANLPCADTDGLVLEAAPEYALYQPHVAVFGGRDGLDVIRGLIATSPAGTRLAVEHAAVHTEEVRQLLHRPETHRDAAGNPRVTVGVTKAT